MEVNWGVPTWPTAEAQLLLMYFWLRNVNILCKFSGFYRLNWSLWVLIDPLLPYQVWMACAYGIFGSSIYSAIKYYEVLRVRVTPKCLICAEDVTLALRRICSACVQRPVEQANPPLSHSKANGWPSELVPAHRGGRTLLSSAFG